jgi:hypothetical protein
MQGVIARLGILGLQIASEHQQVLCRDPEVGRQLLQDCRRRIPDAAGLNQREMPAADACAGLDITQGFSLRFSKVAQKGAYGSRQPANETTLLADLSRCLCFRAKADNVSLKQWNEVKESRR